MFNLKQAPVFTIHRHRVTGNDGAITGIPTSLGTDARGYDDVVVNFLPTGAGSATVTLYYKSDAVDAWIAPSPAVSWNITGAESVRFSSGGRRFFMHVSSLTFSELNIEVAGVIPRQEQFA